MFFFSSAYAAQSLVETCDYVLMQRAFFFFGNAEYTDGEVEKEKALICDQTLPVSHLWTFGRLRRKKKAKTRDNKKKKKRAVKSRRNLALLQ